jgi:hypothetical protein
MAMVSVAVVTVPANAKALPVHDVVLPTVMPASSMSVPMNVEFAPSVVAAAGVQNTLHADALLARATIDPSVELRAPADLKM